jgi:cytochrome c oxidase subunit 1/cytochrome c oxidase subunit I+III
MHLTGLRGMPRRIYTYGPDFGWNTLNMITSVGAFVLAIGILLFLIDVVVCLRRGARAGNNPWDAPTLEWIVASPPPDYNFVVIPTVVSRHPLWEDRLGETEERSLFNRGWALDNGRETLATTPIDAEPDAILKMPEDSFAPLILAIGLSGLFVAMLMQSGGGGALALCVVLVAMLTWLWPERVAFRPVEASHG